MQSDTLIVNVSLKVARSARPNDDASVCVCIIDISYNPTRRLDRSRINARLFISIVPALLPRESSRQTSSRLARCCTFEIYLRSRYALDPFAFHSYPPFLRAESVFADRARAQRLFFQVTLGRKTCRAAGTIYRVILPSLTGDV